MPIISVIEKKTLKGHLVIGAFYLLLAIGGLSMIYPFLLMLRLSTADMTDNNTLNAVPAFWNDNDSLAKKYLIKRYYGLGQNPYAPEVGAAFAPMPISGPEWTVAGFPDLSGVWKEFSKPFGGESLGGQRRQIADYREFLNSLSPLDYVTVDWDPDPDFLTFKEFMDRNLKLDEATRSIRYLVRPDATIRDWHAHPDGSLESSLLYKKWAEPKYRRPLYPAWSSFLQERYGQFDTSKLNQAYGSTYRSWTEVRFPFAEPSAGPERTDYEAFVMRSFPHMWTVVKGDFQEKWTKFLQQEQRIHSPEDWKNLTGIVVPSIQSIPFTTRIPESEGWALQWSAFVHKYVPLSNRDLQSPDRRYIAFLRQKYGAIQTLNAAWNTRLTSWGKVDFAQQLEDYRTLVDRSSDIKVALTFHPYRVAIGFLTRESKAILNTLYLMVLALVASLSVNPLAAYALSRFRIRGSHKILLFILATMALPAEIAMVPSFLLVKNLGLMNSYMALVLPGAASAFGIFLLKGFFDSLPSELYEAATLDGAKELTIFARITIPLATPILAVTAMGAVLGAYGSFVPAILYLPNEDLWPIMPRLFSMSTQHDVEITYGVNMAALVIGSIPTFLVFLFAQRQIMRGIILPTFK